MFQETNQGICFKVKVIPKASISKLVGWENGELKIRLCALPQKGKANGELLSYLSKILGTAKMNIHLVRGEASRRKCICVEGMKVEELQAKITRVISTETKE